MADCNDFVVVGDLAGGVDVRLRSSARDKFCGRVFFCASFFSDITEVGDVTGGGEICWGIFVVVDDFLLVFFAGGWGVIASDWGESVFFSSSAVIFCVDLDGFGNDVDKGAVGKLLIGSDFIIIGVDGVC